MTKTVEEYKAFQVKVKKMQTVGQEAHNRLDYLLHEGLAVALLQAAHDSRCDTTPACNCEGHRAMAANQYNRIRELAVNAETAYHTLVDMQKAWEDFYGFKAENPLET